MSILKRKTIVHGVRMSTVYTGNTSITYTVEYFYSDTTGRKMRAISKRLYVKSCQFSNSINRTDAIPFGQWSIRASHVNYSGCMGIEFAIVKGMFGDVLGARVNSGVRTYRGLFYRAYVILRQSP